jgi:diguanylate cyclase (GGDEF)-like protein/PAS domain S-box-containing protein
MRKLATKVDEQLRIAAIAFESQEGMLVSDANNVILRVNHAFTNITGYTSEEVIGKTPQILHSGRHDANFFAAMWKSIKNTGSWKGEIWNRHKNGESYPEYLNITAVKDQNGTVTNYIATLNEITMSSGAADEIKHLAFYDPLTGLPNRRLLMDRLQQAFATSARTGRRGALLIIDLDNFKTLNDTLGHDIGDLLLKQAAQRLEYCVREDDTVARLGGDEFVVLLEDLNKDPLEAATQTEAVGDKIRATLNQIYHLASHEHHSTPSIGAAIYSDHDQSQEELLKQADIAMYQAKKAGRNTLRFFDPHMQDVINAHAALENELHKALEKGQFRLYYQIQVDSLHCPLGAEALIRWVHPERGLVSPVHFIPLAEETGLILPIGQWVLETACAQIKAWEQNALTCDLILAVNVSAKQIHQADFVAQVQSLVQRHAINPALLKLELTESMLLENIEDIIATMNALKEIGVQFSLDDFGTGYSSLQYLKRLPLNQLKIDQSFIRDLAADSSDKAIVRTIIAMAQSLNLDVIAEGVETEEQRQTLRNKGCTNYQGFLFGKPIPIEQFEAIWVHGESPHIL